ncbi:TraR/DksA family transcriptional regulator [Curvibacter sp. HBC61]|uniref:TraR/DksA family transcriptional regulator n=1 Tax=Curvibacter cyanobacteriorum TaxID=3026422 RepID=A0ABT5N4P0_9BURK|nr:TraR/DksA family transcriptional regulator [Curvibacter sp. HBC61]MDD0841052.1 TraR/DksA family transcriptional regulator [Curvibacter sp. HBC61]
MHPHLTTPYREQLQAQRASLLDQLAQQRGGLVDRANALGRAPQPEESRAQSATERELAYALDEREISEIAAIDAALQRIQDGRYGECTACGVDIPAARLHAAPEAERCIACQEALEHAHPA